MKEIENNLLRACEALINAYNRGKRNGGSIDWSDLDYAYELACEAVAKTIAKRMRHESRQRPSMDEAIYS